MDATDVDSRLGDVLGVGSVYPAPLGRKMIVCQENGKGVLIGRKGLIQGITTNPPRTSSLKPTTSTLLAAVVATMMISDVCSNALEEGFITQASWYDRKSCLKESGQFRMSSGKLLDDDKFTCAVWGYSFGTKLRVTRLDRPHLSVIVTVEDRGPSKKLCKKGRRLDLSRKAAEVLQMLEEGVALVKVERIG
jgi:rare lipoprotein A (peptidoglycan hydrolase)